MKLYKGQKQIQLILLYRRKQSFQNLLLIKQWTNKVRVTTLWLVIRLSRFQSQKMSLILV